MSRSPWPVWARRGRKRTAAGPGCGHRRAQDGRVLCTSNGSNYGWDCMGSAAFHPPMRPGSGALVIGGSVTNIELDIMFIESLILQTALGDPQACSGSILFFDSADSSSAASHFTTAGGICHQIQGPSSLCVFKMLSHIAIAV